MIVYFVFRGAWWCIKFGEFNQQTWSFTIKIGDPMFNGSMVGFGVEEIYDNLCAGNSRKSWYNCPRISKLAKAAQSKKHFPTISDGTMMDEVCQKRERERERKRIIKRNPANGQLKRRLKRIEWRTSSSDGLNEAQGLSYHECPPLSPTSCPR